MKLVFEAHSHNHGSQPKPLPFLGIEVKPIFAMLFGLDGEGQVRLGDHVVKQQLTIHMLVVYTTHLW